MDPVELRRVRHVVSENWRVLGAARALGVGNLIRTGTLMRLSHESLRDDYEVSSPQLDELVRIACDEPFVAGARLTGAGFGGCVVALAWAHDADAACARIVERYRARTGLPGRGWVCSPADGARVVSRNSA